MFCKFALVDHNLSPNESALKVPGQVVRTFIVFLVAFCFRYVAITKAPYSLTGDEPEYATLAYNLRTHHTLSFGGPHPWGYHVNIPGPGPLIPTASRAPLYPAVLAALWSENSPTAPIFRARMFNALAGSLTAAMCGQIAFGLFGEASAWAAGLGVALAPETAFLSTMLLSETVFIVLSVSAAWAWLEGKHAICGVLAGLAILTRSIFLPLAVLGLAVGVITRRRPILMAACISLVTIAPWTVRNFVSTGSFVVVNTQGWGSNLFYGTMRAPYEVTNVWSGFGRQAKMTEINWADDETETEHNMLKLAFRDIGRHPFTWVATRFHEFPRALKGSDLPFSKLSPFPYRINHLLYLSMMPVLLVLAIAGVIKNRDMLTSVIPLAIPPAALIGSQTISVEDIRYTLPGVPFLIILASSLLRRSRRVFVNGAPV